MPSLMFWKKNPPRYDHGGFLALPGRRTPGDSLRALGRFLRLRLLLLPRRFAFGVIGWTERRLRLILLVLILKMRRVAASLRRGSRMGLLMLSCLFHRRRCPVRLGFDFRGDGPLRHFTSELAACTFAWRFRVSGLEYFRQRVAGFVRFGF